MEAYGDGETAVWAVSFGLTGDYASQVTQAVRMAREEWPWLGPMLWAAWSPDDVHGDYALNPEQTVRSAAAVALIGLATEPAVAWPGSYPADHPSGNYDGDWRVTAYGADIGSSEPTVSATV